MPTQPSFDIRLVEGETVVDAVHPLQGYAFGGSPHRPDPADRGRDLAELEHTDDHVRLVSYVADQPVACAVGIPMRQNVRDLVLPMLGISGVATHPTARRRGHVRALLDDLHTQLRDAGHAVATLYPFKPSFYERFGYASFPKPRAVQLFPGGLERLLDADVPGNVSMHRIGDAYPAYAGFLDQALHTRHGFSTFPPGRAAGVERANERWLALAEHDGEVVGVLLYRTEGIGRDLIADTCLWQGPLGRTLLLRWLALHGDQFGSFRLPLPPDEHPDTWITDVSASDESNVGNPFHAPMGRVLRVEGLAGVTTGIARVTVDVVDDPFVAGTWTLDGTSGTLEVSKGSDAQATLTANGLAALVYGVLDPAEFGWRGYGQVSPDAAEALRTLFPARTPYLHAGF